MSPDITGARWRKSSFSNTPGGDCVEVADLADQVAVRDSKNPNRCVLTFPADAWRTFLDHVDEL